MTASAEAIIARALRDGNVHVEVPDAIARQILNALDAAGLVVKTKPKPRKPAAPVEVFSPNTGDAALDEFMRNHHDPKYRPAKMPTAPGLPSISLSEKERDRLATAWTSACNARKGDPDLRAEDAATLAEVIRIHRSPWHRDGRVFRSTEHDWTIEERGSYWRVIDPQGTHRRPRQGVTTDGDFYRFADAETFIKTA